ncbi:MAG TPA: glycine betaine ABC transporter substrate-binding protein [Steroidobacteraceae bacterium]|jgi:osmoprotectant transport system permease protein|nr:glycine betaine ABC transporter substrate-binding protein [Steroidobacteraceae bacterium]
MRRCLVLAGALWCCLGSGLGSAAAAPAGPGIGSKNFTESIILADILQLQAQRRGLSLIHHRAMGGSAILWQALLDGSIDAYPEYTGTITQQLLHGLPPRSPAQLAAALAARGLGISASMGFEDRYALAVEPALAAKLQLRTLSDLASHPQLRYALSNEFMRRGDGWPGLRSSYGLAPRSLRGIDHSLAYRALVAGAADVIDVYTTDAEIEQYHLVVLRDDRHYFPSYQAVWLYRLAAAAQRPALLRSINDLAGRIDVRSMRRMNAAVQIRHDADGVVAAQFVATLPGPAGPAGALAAAAQRPPIRDIGERSLGARLLQRTREHLALVGVSLGLALLVGLPIGILAARWAPLGRAVLAVCVVLQTVPTLAMLVFMIPLFGIGAEPAIAALFFYSLLPIVRNTLTGLTSIPAAMEESAASLGLPQHVRLLRIELPLATRTILAGISTAAVINVGTATLGALIGAGGYGDPILTGIRLDDLSLILEGAIPAAVLALLVMAVFQLLEHVLTPRGLRRFREG